jgi:hypothetical protein
MNRISIYKFQFGGVDKYFIRVKRTNVLEDSYNKIMHEKNPELFRMPYAADISYIYIDI